VNQAAAPAAQRVLTASVALEPGFIAGLSPLPARNATDFYQRIFNAFLDLYDDQERPLPYLAEALPALNTDTWQVFPDGTMQTRYHLKPNLVWHDGSPLVADDFAFSYQVATTANGFRTAVAPYTLMDSVTAPDDRTIIIHWKSIYPDASVLLVGDVKFGLVPMPRKILEQTFSQGVEAIQNSTYWAHDFVGAGPYKVDKWDTGNYLEAVAFDQHILGRAKIDRIRLLFISDQNTAFANILAGSTDVALDSIGFSHVLQLKQEWAGTNKGTAGVTLASFTAAYIQHRPDYAKPAAILDVRVHRALADAIDKQTFADTIWAGELQPIDTIFSRSADYYPIIDKAITKYPYDPRTSERLMTEAGYTKGADGFYTSPTEGKLTFGSQTPIRRPEQPALAANWRQVGFDFAERELSPTEGVDAEIRATFPSMFINPAGLNEVQQTAVYHGTEVMSPDRGWRGENVPGYSNPAYDRLWDAWSITLDPNQRTQIRAQMAKILSDDLPSIMLTANPNAHAFLSTVKNIAPTTPYKTTGRITWNIDKWELA
jgi:peptide/nickel transport system substrate-binding protein